MASRQTRGQRSVAAALASRARTRATPSSLPLFESGGERRGRLKLRRGQERREEALPFANITNYFQPAVGSTAPTSTSTSASASSSTLSSPTRVRRGGGRRTGRSRREEGERVIRQASSTSALTSADVVIVDSTPQQRPRTRRRVQAFEVEGDSNFDQSGVFSPVVNAQPPPHLTPARDFCSPDRQAKHLTCAVCQDVFKSPVVLPCGHSYCAACIYQWLEHSRTCPECRSSATPSKVSPTIVLDNIVQDLKVYCNFKEKGCSWTGSLSACRDHIKACSFGPRPAESEHARRRKRRRIEEEEDEEDSLLSPNASLRIVGLSSRPPFAIRPSTSHTSAPSSTASSIFSPAHSASGNEEERSSTSPSSLIAIENLEEGVIEVVDTEAHLPLSQQYESHTAADHLLPMHSGGEGGGEGLSLLGLPYSPIASPLQQQQHEEEERESWYESLEEQTGMGESGVNGEGESGESDGDDGDEHPLSQLSALPLRERLRRRNWGA